MELNGREPSVQNEGDDFDHEEEIEYEELEINEELEEPKVPNVEVPSILLDLTSGKKVNVKHPAPKDPVLPDLNMLREHVAQLSRLLCHPAPAVPPRDFAHVGGRHHKLGDDPHILHPHPREMRSTKPLPGFVNDAEELLHLRNNEESIRKSQHAYTTCQKENRFR